MKMQTKTQTQIIDEIKNETELTAIEIIRSGAKPNKCSVIINDEMFSIGYETEYSFDLIMAIKTTVTDEIPVIFFNDVELPEAWKLSYLEAGITKERFDRRTEFNAYNDMNEMFCIDRILLWQITGKDNRMANWKKGIIKWYQNHLI